MLTLVKGVAAANNGTAAAGGNTAGNGQAGNGQANLPTAGKSSEIQKLQT
jgi:hypothetical protein